MPGKIADLFDVRGSELTTGKTGLPEPWTVDIAIMPILLESADSLPARVQNPISLIALRLKRPYGVKTLGLTLKKPAHPSRTLSIIILVMICGAFLVSHYYNPEPFNEMGQTMLQYGPSNDSVDSRSQDTQRNKLFTILGIIFFAGFIFWVWYLKAKKGSLPDGSPMKEVSNK